MSKTRNFANRYLASTAGALALLAMIVGANALLRPVVLRADLTEDRLYSLSPGTRNLLAALDRELPPGTQVVMRLYRSRQDNAMPVWLRGFAARVEDLLKEYAEHAHGRVAVEILDPSPDSDAEDAAALDGISGQPLPNGIRFHLGLAVRCLDQTAAIPFLSPMEEAKLEYDLTRAIYEATRARKPEVGLVSSLPIMGGAIAPYMAMNRRPKPPWIFMQELQRNFTVKDLGPQPDRIPAEIGVVVIVHPQEVPDATAYALDQFVLRGGKLIVAVDPHCVVEARNNPEAMMGRMIMPGFSNLPRLFKAWGVAFTPEKVAADLDLAMRGQREDGQLESYPCVLSLRDFKGGADVVMNSMNHINLVYAGTFSGEPAGNLHRTVLAATTRNSQMIERFLAESPGSSLTRNFAPDDQKKALMIRLQGRFPAAFPDGPPMQPEKPAGQEPDQAGGDAAKAAAAPPADHLKEAAADSVVILVGDVDFLADEFCVTRQDFFGQKIIRPFNDNLAMIQGLVEFLAGSDDLISIRAKKIKERPFTRIVKMQAAVQDRYEAEIAKAEEQRDRTQTRINELQQQRNDANRLALSPEQREEIRRYEREMAETNKLLKKLRKEWRRDIDRLQLRLQVLNIAGVPLLVVLAGLAVWGAKRLRATRARRTAR